VLELVAPKQEGRGVTELGKTLGPANSTIWGILDG
jgi:hypothetical protein